MSEQVQSIHPLLARQLKRSKLDLSTASPEVLELIAMVEGAYKQADFDRSILERSMELSSAELVDQNAELKEMVRSLPEIFETLGPVDLENHSIREILEGYVSELISSRQVLNDAKVAAELNAKARAAFLANMSHEIRTPMNGVIGMVELIMADEGLDEELLDRLKTIRLSGQSLLRIIDDILDLSKLEAGKLEICYHACILQNVFEYPIAILRQQTKEKGIKLTLTIDRKLPRKILCDDLRVGQVLTNLVGNATKFTNSSGQIWVRVLQNDDRLRVEVRDTGIGISKEKLDEIFKPFSQADNTTTRRFGGTGLGLSISKQLVELMQGTIGAESMVGRGSTFWFELPLVHAHGSQIEQRSEQRFGAVKGLNFLVAEDNLVNQKVITKLLEREGHTYTLARDGVEATEIFRRSPSAFDLILMDCHMPRMNGYEASRSIRDAGPTGANVFIIAFTASVTTEDKQLCLDSGMNEVLAKPMVLADLRRILATRFCSQAA